MGLGGKVLQEQSIHRALEPDVKLGDLAFGQSDDPDARELEMLVQDGHIGLVARNAVQGFGQHDVELACLRVLQERLDAWAQGDAGARRSEERREGTACGSTGRSGWWPQ